MINVLTVDVEDYFHPTEVSRWVDTATWDRLDPRVEQTTSRVLEILDRFGVHASFFILGWVARRHPGLVRQIAAAGHEIGCHGYSHRLVYQLTPEEFKRDTKEAVAAIEDSCGLTPRVYRAPSYSITRQSMWALEVLAESGFTHDSSVYPIRHDRYGIPGFDRHAQTLHTPSGSILEVPIATVELADQTVTPVGGGGYLRLFPYRYTAAGIRRLNRSEGQPACIYFHPWELDPEQPRLASGFLSRVRTYCGLRSMEGKIRRLLNDFEFSSLTAVHPARPAVATAEATMRRT